MSHSPQRRPARIERAVAAACMALLCIITFVNVVTRYLTNASFAFTEEVSVFLLVLLTLLGSVAAFIDGGHIRITLIVNLLPKHFTGWVIDGDTPVSAGTMDPSSTSFATAADPAAMQYPGEHALSRLRASETSPYPAAGGRTK